MSAPDHASGNPLNQDVDGDGLYELADAPPVPSPGRLPAQRVSPELTAPSKGGAGAVNPVISRSAPQRTLAYRAPKQDAPDLDTDLRRDRYGPLWLLCGGIVIGVAHDLVVWRFQSGGLRSLLQVMTDFWLGVIASTVLMTVAMLLAAKLRHMSLGRLPTAVLKLSAISVAPAAVMIMIRPVFWFIPVFGGIAEMLGHFALFFALIGVLFDFDESDTWFCVAVMFLVNLATYLGLTMLVK
jgi:hypothetical protein